MKGLLKLALVAQLLNAFFLRILLTIMDVPYFYTVILTPTLSISCGNVAVDALVMPLSFIRPQSARSSLTMSTKRRNGSYRPPENPKSDFNHFTPVSPSNY
jgi:hypothetical protein